MPFGVEMENLDKFPSCSEATRIYIGQKSHIMEPCLGTQRIPEYIFGKFDVSLICSCLETAICISYTVTIFSRPKSGKNECIYWDTAYLKLELN